MEVKLNHRQRSDSGPERTVRGIILLMAGGIIDPTCIPFFAVFSSYA